MQAFGQDNNQGIYQNLPLVSEEWFGPQNIPQIDLEECEVELLLASAMSDWSAVDPVIFGNISEACFSHEERLAGGIYYTCEADIMRIVRFNC